jgi:hypothetical protein
MPCEAKYSRGKLEVRANGSCELRFLLSQLALIVNKSSDTNDALMINM